jgi:uncharacterized protein (TIGR02466 family)
MNPKAAKAFQEAQALQRSGKPSDAFEKCRIAIKAAKNDPDILAFGGACAAMAGRTADAEKWLGRAMLAAPGSAQTAFNLAMLQQQSGAPDKALATLDRALVRNAGEARLHYMRGVLLQQTGRLTESCDAYREAVRLNPGMADAWFNLGTAEDALERPAAAKEAYEKTLELQPGNWGARYNLSTALLKSGDPAASLDGFEAVIAARPDFGDAYVNLGNALQELERYDAAIERYQAALDRKPDSREARYNMAKACQAAGYHERCIAACDAMLERRADDAGALAFKAVALNDLGRGEEAAFLVDMQRFIMLVDIEVPEGYADIGAFNAALEAHIMAHPTLQEDPANHATRNGQHTGELLSDPKGPFAAFEDAVNKAVAAYIERHGADGTHPFLTDPPKDWRLTVWAVVMRMMGHQVAHIHPVAWLSGVYYARLPSILDEENPGREGWLEFGEPQPDLKPQRQNPIDFFQPKLGRLFLFPSYFYHRTVPFEAAETRISIAFDILRKD